VIENYYVAEVTAKTSLGQSHQYIVLLPFSLLNTHFAFSSTVLERD